MVRSSMFRAGLVAALALLATAGQANPVYKCVSSEGKTTYSEMPCYGEQWKRIDARDAPVPKREVAARPAADTTVAAKPTPTPTKTVKPPAAP